MRKTLALSALLFSLPVLSFAQVRLPAIISEHMILQQQSRVRLWGWAAPGEKVQISTSWNGHRVDVISDAKGAWSVQVPTGKAGGPYTITFQAANKVVVGDVLLGEVWLASGQSNMEFFIGKTSNKSYNGVINHDEVLRDAEYPRIRSIDVPNRVSDSVQSDFAGAWQLCSAATVDTFSAVAFFFARKVHKATGYPVGIINATWGGTPAESWTRREVLQADTALRHILERYEKTVAGYPEANEQYKARFAAWKSDTARSKGSAPSAPIGPTHNKSPYKLYNGMIAPVEPYSIRGVIWYQGESNADRPTEYRRLFPAMIASWRSAHRDPKLPFYFVQVSPHRSNNADIRDAQLFAFRSVPYTGMAVTTDNGDSLNIHPRNKELVGHRLALWALKNQYGQKELEASGPVYRDQHIEGSRIRLRFDHAKGLVAKDGPLTEFTIAGTDGRFVPAQAIIEGETILVWSDEVPAPKAVRFAWKHVPHPNLFNAAGLPASPFRTDY
jgi:sialate O-acetylesterase